MADFVPRIATIVIESIEDHMMRADAEPEAVAAGAFTPLDRP